MLRKWDVILRTTKSFKQGSGGVNLKQNHSSYRMGNKLEESKTGCKNTVLQPIIIVHGLSNSGLNYGNGVKDAER